MVLARFEYVIKKFIKDSIVLEDSGLYEYDENANKSFIDSVEAKAVDMQKQMKENTFDLTYFLFLEGLRRFVKREELRGYFEGMMDGGYPLGRHGTRPLECDAIRNLIYLTESDKKVLVKCKGSRDLVSTMTDMFYNKFCRFVIAERKNYIKNGNEIKRPEPAIFSFQFQF